jgi:hypothetical protein
VRQKAWSKVLGIRSGGMVGGGGVLVADDGAAVVITGSIVYK